jgi:tetratricopeptide (TPR) repeat protein
MLKRMMERWIRLVLGVLLATILLTVTGCSKLRARYELNKGVEACKSGHPDEASVHFENALRLDPSLELARIYLANSYRSDWAGIDDHMDAPENRRQAEQAIDKYKKTLESQSAKTDRITSLKGIAALYFDLKEFDKAKDYRQKVLEQDPQDPEAYYAIGVIDWTQTFGPDQAMRQRLNMKPAAPLANRKACEELRSKNQALVQEGIDMLNQAINLRKDYDDAMAYLNLMYRQKADIECGHPALRAADLKQADNYVEQALAIKKRKAEEEMKQDGIAMDQTK